MKLNIIVSMFGDVMADAGNNLLILVTFEEQWTESLSQLIIGLHNIKDYVEDSLLKLAVQREKTPKSPNQTNSKTGKRKLFHQKKFSQQELEKALPIILNKWIKRKKRKNKKIKVKKLLKKGLKPLKNIVFRWKKRKKRKMIQNNLDE